MSGQNSWNPAIWLVPGAGGIFRSCPLTIRFRPLMNPQENFKWNHVTPAQRNVEFFLLKWNFSLTNFCKVKEKVSSGINGLVILRKGEYSCVSVDKTLLACFYRVWHAISFNAAELQINPLTSVSRLKFCYFPCRSLFLEISYYLVPFSFI